MSPTAVGRFPLQVTLGRRPFTFRPLERGDEKELAAFFKRLGVDERSMLKDDVTNALVIASWCSQIDYDRVFPLLAIEGARVVADATLHRSRRGWSRHVGELRVTVDPSCRGIGLARALIRELVDVAEKSGVAILDASAMVEQKTAIRVFEDLGFVAIATLPQHVVDLTHQPHDLVVMSKTVIPVERLSPDAWKSAEEVDEGGGG